MVASRYNISFVLQNGFQIMIEIEISLDLSIINTVLNSEEFLDLKYFGGASSILNFKTKQ